MVSQICRLRLGASAETALKAGRLAIVPELRTEIQSDYDLLKAGEAKRVECVAHALPGLRRITDAWRFCSL
jgi:hypothetical protein